MFTPKQKLRATTQPIAMPDHPKCVQCDRPANGDSFLCWECNFSVPSPSIPPLDTWKTSLTPAQLAAHEERMAFIKRRLELMTLCDAVFSQSPIEDTDLYEMDPDLMEEIPPPRPQKRQREVVDLTNTPWEVDLTLDSEKPSKKRKI